MGLLGDTQEHGIPASQERLPARALSASLFAGLSTTLPCIQSTVTSKAGLCADTGTAPDYGCHHKVDQWHGEALAQIGYLVGPAPLISAAAKAHSFLIFTVPSNLQRAVAYGLDHEESFYRCVRAQHSCCLATLLFGRRAGVLTLFSCVGHFAITKPS